MPEEVDAEKKKPQPDEAISVVERGARPRVARARDNVNIVGGTATCGSVNRLQFPQNDTQESIRRSWAISKCFFMFINLDIKS